MRQLRTNTRQEGDAASISTRTASLSACVRRVGASEFVVVAGADRTDIVIGAARHVTAADVTIEPRDLVLLDGSRDLCWSVIPQAAKAGASAVIIARDWTGEAPAMLAAFAERLQMPLFAWNAETTWSALRSRFEDAIAESAVALDTVLPHSWGPSLVLDLLEGRVEHEQLVDFDIEAGACVIALRPVQSSKIVGATEEALDRSIWLSLLDPEVPSDVEGVRLGQTAYVIVRHRRSEAELREIAEHLRRLLSVTLDRAVLAAIGSLVAQPADIAESRYEADKVLALAHRRTNPCTSTLADVQHLALLEQAAAVLTAQPHLLSQKLAILRRSDATRNTSYVAVLRAFLDNFGDVNTSAERLGMHHNTFRYRLKRGVEIAGINLEDPAERLALQVELALDS